MPGALVFSWCLQNTFFFFNLGEMFIQGGEWRMGGVGRNAVGWVRETLKETKFPTYSPGQLLFHPGRQQYTPQGAVERMK